MTRVIGILCGSALAIAFLLFAFGVPRLSKPEPVPQVVEEVVEYVPEPVAIPEVPANPEPLAVAEEPAAVEAVPEPIIAEVEAVLADVATETAVEEHWYAFWSPFRSELAANGFIEQLQRTTGLDYRVVKQKVGVYEVAFAYTDENDIDTKLARISEATGLEMPGG